MSDLITLSELHHPPLPVSALVADKSLARAQWAFRAAFRDFPLPPTLASIVKTASPWEEHQKFGDQAGTFKSHCAASISVFEGTLKLHTLLTSAITTICPMRNTKEQ